MASILVIDPCSTLPYAKDRRGRLRPDSERLTQVRDGCLPDVKPQSFSRSPCSQSDLVFDHTVKQPRINLPFP